MQSQLLGNDPIKQFITVALKKRALGNTLLFSGPEGIGKKLFAKEFAQEILGEKVLHGTHPDFHLYLPEGKSGMHSIESMRELSSQVALLPQEANVQIFVIDEADRMLPTSANALLKTFEEPPLHSMIFLITSSPESLLPTIVSRARRLSFQPISNELLLAHFGEKLRPYIRFARGSYTEAERLSRMGLDPEVEAILAYFRQERNLYDTAKAITVALDEKKALREKAARGARQEHLSAQAKEHLEKELEGFLTMQFQKEVRALFEIILECAREKRQDLELMERDHRAVEEAELAMHRYLPVLHIFETLLLKIS